MQLDAKLVAASKFARAIMKASNLSVVIPMWSDGDHMNVGTIEDVHGRKEWIHRANIDRVNGEWVVSEVHAGSEDLIALVADVWGALAKDAT